MATENIQQPLVSGKQPDIQLATEKYKSAAGWFWSGLIRYPGLMITSWIFMLITAVLAVIPGILLGLGIDILKTDGFGSVFIYIILGIVGAALLTWATSFISSYLWGLAGYRFEFFDVVQEHSMAFHDQHDSGVLLSMGMNETNQIRFAYHPSLRHLINSFLSIILTTIYFFIRIPVGSNFIGVGKWEIGLGITFGFVVYVILAWRYAAKIGPVRRELATELGNVSAASQEAFRGIDVVRSKQVIVLQKRQSKKVI
ncbi:MAG: ABC transporter transmembrane domain-containing protein [Candidatus Heimdallarchaeota archaeon]